MVLSTSELVASLQDEVRVLLHLIGKIEPAMLDYRPTPGQRSTLELLRYLSMMGPTLVRMGKAGTFDADAWTAAEHAAATCSFDEATQALAGHADEYAALLADLSDADMRTEVTMFGPPSSRGAFLVTTVLCGLAAYRMQLFLYLKACGRHELDSMNLWAGVDGQAAATDSPADDDVALSIRQFAGAWRLMCADAPSAAVAVTDGVEYVFAGAPVPFFNIALVTGRGLTADDLQRLGREACEWAAPHGVPWLLIVTHERLAAGTDAASALEACGLIPAIPMTGMRAQQLTPAAAPPPAGLTLGVTADDAACAAIVDVNAVAYAMDLEAAKPLVGRQDFWKDHVAVVGVADETPASSAAVLMVNGYRYVALVATRPEQQRRGFADATMRHALDVSAQREGDRPTFLHATDAGRPVYERMGYQPVSTHTAFMEKRFLEGH